MRRLLPLLLLVTPVAGTGQTIQPAPSPDDNARLTALFDADQHDRRPPAGQAIDWNRVEPADEARRAEVRKMLDTGAVKTGTDYYHAAFVYQHGDEPNDYLLAHTLGMTAMAKGRADAGWITAATLDRYLEYVGQSQVYGTQFNMKPRHPTTQEPYNRTLISDAQRRAIGVPMMAEQDARRRKFDTERANASSLP